MISSQGTPKETSATQQKVLSGAFFWLSAFYFVYSARPEEWVPLLGYLPLAKITAGFAALGLLVSAGRTKRSFKNLPREASYLLALICMLFVSAFLSPVWRGGAFWHTVDFAKVYIAWVLTYLLCTNWARLRHLIFIQTASVSIIAIISIAKGHSLPRLEGVIGGIYSNPNDLAFAIVMSLPFNLAFLLTSKTLASKLSWTLSLMLKTAALLMTASRAGAIDFVCAGAVCLWIMGVKGRRVHLLIATGVIGVLLLGLFGGKVKERFEGTSEGVTGEGFQSGMAQQAYGSYEARAALMRGALAAIARYPILGIGANNFTPYSGSWHEVHMTYLQIAAEGGIPCLILYLLFVRSGFKNVNLIGRVKNLDPEFQLFNQALYACLIGFVVGALFAPEAYHYFPIFAIGYSSVMVALARERGDLPPAEKGVENRPKLYKEVYARDSPLEPVATVR